MAVKTIYLLDTVLAGTQHLATQDGGTAPALASMSTGWVPGLTAINNFSAMDSLAKPVNTSFGATALPAAATVPNNTSGDSWVLGPFDGTFPAGNWTFSFVMIGVTRAGDAGAGSISFRVLRGTDPTGAGATEVTSAAQLSTAGNVMNATGGATVTATWAAPAMTLVNEYLFVKVAFKVTTAGGNGATDTVFRKGSSSSVTTTDFAATFVPSRKTRMMQAVGQAANW